MSPICFSVLPMGTVAVVKPRTGAEILPSCDNEYWGARLETHVEVLANLAGEALPTSFDATFYPSTPGFSRAYYEAGLRGEMVLATIYKMNGEYFVINMQHIGLDGEEVYPGATVEGVLPEPLPDTLPELAEAFTYADAHFREVCPELEGTTRLRDKPEWKRRELFFRREQLPECVEPR